MITELLAITIFTTFVALGVHAVTRPDKLLAFLAIRINTIETIDMLGNQYKNELLLLQKQLETDCRDIDSGYSNALQQLDETDTESIAMLGSDYQLRKLELISNYQEARKQLDVLYGLEHQQQVIDDSIDKQENRWSYRLLWWIAPALTECQICMSSVWSIVTMSLYYSGALEFKLLCYPLACLLIPFAVAGVIWAIVAISDNSSTVAAIEKLTE